MTLNATVIIATKLKKKRKKVLVKNLFITSNSTRQKQKTTPCGVVFCLLGQFPTRGLCIVATPNPDLQLSLSLVVDRVIARAEVFRRSSVYEACCSCGIA